MTRRKANKPSLDSLLPAELPGKLSALLAAVNRADQADLELDAGVSIFFLRNFTIEPIEPYLKYHIYCSRLRPIVRFGNYGVVQQELLDDRSAFSRAAPDIAVLSLVAEELDGEFGSPAWNADAAIERVHAFLNGLLEARRGAVVVNTMIPPFVTRQGLVSVPNTRDTGSEVARLNGSIREAVSEHPGRLVLADWERIIRILGRQDALDARFWYQSRAPFKPAFLDLYAREIAKVARALHGMTKKCLVLDCDGTLWGGIVGEAGLEGVQLDPHEWPGRAYFELQQTIQWLVRRGTILALCSRNNEKDVWEVFDAHPNSLLQRSDIAAWRINWNNKVDNLVSLAEELNIGLDSLVFLDDDARECDIVRQALPDVHVIQVPQALERLPELLVEDGLFDALKISAVDTERTTLYQKEANRREELERFTDIRQYLKSLQMIAQVAPAVSDSISRVAQLTQRTNQFNLTTRRYSVAEIEVFMQDPDSAVLTLTVEDRFGKLGLTGVVIVRREGRLGVVDTLLMSCRILGRDLEFAFVDLALGTLERDWQLESWQAEYIPTPKNAQVGDFWEQAGFSLTVEDNGRRVYSAPCGGRPGDYEAVIEIQYVEEPRAGD